MAPRERRRRSCAFWRFVVRVGVDEGRIGEGWEERRWDSVRRRWRARSLVARADSVASVVRAGGFDLVVGRIGGEGRGGLGVCEEMSVSRWSERIWGGKDEGGGTMNVISSDFRTAPGSTFGWATCSITGTACPSSLSKPAHSESSESLASGSSDTVGAGTI